MIDTKIDDIEANRAKVAKQWEKITEEHSENQKIKDPFEPIGKNDEIKYQLETLATYEKQDIESCEIEVCYENSHGLEGFITVDVTELARIALERIIDLENHILVDEAAEKCRIATKLLIEEYKNVMSLYKKMREKS
jgi:hypothetical protein